MKVKVKKVVVKNKSTPVTAYDSRFWSMEKHGVTQSQIALFSLCPMKAHRKLIEGIELPHRDSNLDFGNFFHEALDKVYSFQRETAEPKKEIIDWDLLEAQNKVLKDCYTTAKEKLKSADIKDKQDFEVVYGMADVILKRYYKRYATEDKHRNWVDIERIFAFPYMLRDGTTTQVRGKFDGVFRDGKGKLWLFETKTKSQIEGNHIMDKIGFDLQVMIYMKAMEWTYGEKPVGVLYNLVKRPGQKFTGKFNRKDETIPDYLRRIDADIEAKTDEYFMRYHVAVQWEEVEQFMGIDFDYVIESMYRWQQGGVASFRNSNACSMWNRPCEYLSVCANNDRSHYVKRLEVFPELKGVAE